MKKIGFIVTVLFCLFMISCMDYTDKEGLIVYNGTDSEIYSILSNSDKISDSDYFASYRYDKTVSAFNIMEIAPDKEQKNKDRPVYWDSFFASSKDKKARLFIISKDSVDKYGWARIVKLKNRVYDKKYLLTKQDLEKAEWKIVYKK